MPYLPDSMKEKVGLWCNYGDWICGSHGDQENVHSTYANDGAAVEKAAIESVAKILM